MKKEIITYRIQRARETYNDAVHLYQNDRSNSCVNRLYYAAFYAAIALLLTKDIEVKSHSGVKRKLNESFVQNKIIPKRLAKVYSILSDYRHKGDYDDLYDFDKEVISELLYPVKEFIDMINEFINKFET